MAQEEKRKLRLGEIIRKMNDTTAKQSGAGVTPPRKPAPVKNGSNAIIRQPVTELPPQPSFQKQTRTAASLTPAPPDPDEQKNSRPGSGAVPSAQPAPAVPKPSQYLADTRIYRPPAPAQPPASSTDDDDDETFDLFRYLNVVMRRKGIIVLATIAVGLFSLFSYVRATKYYTARARLLFKPHQESIIDNRATMIRFGADRQRNFNTHLELLKSNSVLDIAAEALGAEVKTGMLSAGLMIARGETKGEETDIIDLTFRHTDAALAKNALNTICRTYIDYIREVNAQEDTRLILKLDAQIDKVQNDLTMKENDLRRFKENHRMVELSKETNLFTAKLSNMELALQQTQLDLLESKERLTTLRAQIGQQEITVIQSMSYENPMRSKLAQLELDINTLSAEYSPDHFKIKQINQQIENLKQAMLAEIEKEVAEKAVKHTMIKNPIRESLLQTYVNQTVEISAFEAKRIAQEQIIEKLNREMQKLPALELEYAFLERETESLLKTLKMLKMKLEETKIIRDSKESELKILEIARLPMHAVSGKKPSSVIVGILVGLILGIALAFLLEYLDQSLKDPAEVEKSLELPVVGVVPLIETDNAVVNSTNLAKSILEPFRALRANLKHIITQHQAKSFMICSAIKGEGKTTLAVNLAITFAMDGKKVILVDCDLRRSQVHSLLNVAKETGLADYLNASAEVDGIIKPTTHENLFAITSGERPHNPAELLGTQKFETLLQELDPRADIIICDSPALIPVSDALSMAPYIDRCVMVVRAHWTPLKAAKQAKNQLVRIGARLGGGILNGISHSRGYYPYYYGYYGYYAYKYSYDYDKEPPKKFSMRAFGLAVERKIKAGITAIPLSVPRCLAAFSFVAKEILKRPFFWILTLLLAGVIALRLFYFPPGEQRDEAALITYLGDLPETAPIVIEKPASASQLSPGVPAQATDAFSEEPFALRESLMVWVQAFNTFDTARLFALYDSAGFRFPDGGFTQWRRRYTAAAQRSDRDVMFTVDTATVAGLTHGLRETTLVTRVARGSDTLKTENTMTWKKTDNRWRIIREKNRRIDN